MELNGLEADELFVKTQMAVTEKSKKERVTKNKMKSPKHKLQRQYQKQPSKMTNHGNETGHMMTDCPKLAKRHKLEEDPKNVRTAIFLVMKKKAAPLALTWETAHASGP